jgi:hypothetical protein
MTAVRPWKLPVDLDLLILQHLSAEEASVFRLVSKSCRDIINRLDELLFNDSLNKLYHITSNQFTALGANQGGKYFWIDNHLICLTYESVYKIMDSSEDSTTVH